MARCPICDANVKPRAENAVFPFCSPRCKTIDLGKWLSEEYRVPGEDAADDAEEDASRVSPSKGDMRH